MAHHGEAVGTGAGGSGNVVAGTYTGNGAASQSINLGFRPKMVIVKGINGTYKPIGVTIDGIPDAASHSRIYASNGVAADNSQPKVTATGFNVEGNLNDSGFNYSGTVYHYVAIKDGGGGGGSSTLADLTDVDTTDIADGKILKYNGSTTKWEIADDGGGSGGVNVAPAISFSGGGTLTATLTSGMALYQTNSHTAWSSYGTLPSYLVGTKGTDTVNGTPDGSAVTLTITGGSAVCYMLRNEGGWAPVDTTGWSVKATAPTDFTTFNPGIDHIRQKVFPPGSYTLDSYSAMYACSTAPVGGGSPAGSDGQVQFNSAGDFGADAALHWDNTNKRLGIGTAAPAHKVVISENASTLPAVSVSGTLLHLGAADGDTARLVMDVYGTGSSKTANLSLRSAGGTAASPSATAAGDILGQISFMGYGATDYSSARSAIRSTATEAWTDTAQGSKLDFYTSPNGLVASSVRMTIEADGNVGIGTATPAVSALLDVSSTTKGFLPPRMTEAQRDAIASPATGLVVYNTTANALNYWDGDSWEAVGAGTDVLNGAALSSGTFPQANGATVAAAGSYYDLGSMSVERGVYLWTVYNCAGQLSYSSGSGSTIQIVGDARPHVFQHMVEA
ncbi:MAG: hypothetical protein M5U16_01460 [Hyphomicrobium sp.]|nr:hypothetical protein [Hyphomicrobium sp.]